MATSRKQGPNDFRVVTKEQLLGNEQRWRRFGRPTPAGESLKDDGTPDYGLFGPGSVAWEVMLHPSQIFFETIAQGILQFTYKPIFAGVRDVDPLSRKARDGSVTIFDSMDRGQRNSGIHAPMWFGDTGTARRVAKHLQNIHVKVVGDLIDVNEPELGGYQANSPRESTWAGLTELHAMLWVYERLGIGNRRLSDAQRDRYLAESAEYVRLFPHEEVPTSMAELRALYERDWKLFARSETVDVMPANGRRWMEAVAETVMKNFHRSQLRVFLQVGIQSLFHVPVAGAMSGITRKNMGMSPGKSRHAVAARLLLRPLIGLMQWGPIERYYMRLMWGPDAIVLIKNARALHAEAKRERKGSFVALGGH